MFDRPNSHSGKAPFYGSQTQIDKSRSHGLSDEEPTADVSTSSTVSVDGERPVPSAQIYALVSRLSSSANAMVKEAEALSSLISGINPRIHSYNHMLAGMRSMVQELSDICPEPERTESGVVNANGISENLVCLQSPQRRPILQIDAKCQNARTDTASDARMSEQSSGAQSLKYLAMPGIKTPRPKQFNPAAKRPLSDFNFFCRDARKLVVEAHPEYTKEQVNKELGRIWSMLDRNSRQHYRVMYVQDKQRYSKDVAAQSDVSDKSSFKPGGSGLAMANGGGLATTNNSSARVRGIIWKCATEHSCVSVDKPRLPGIRTSLEFVGGNSGASGGNGGPTNGVRTGFLLQSNLASQQVCGPSPIYRSNTINSILNDSCDSGAIKEACESDDVDEPLARALARGSGHSVSGIPSIYHPSREHRLRETAAVATRTPAGNF
ncbi:high mobility group [Coemansia sp. RSA 1722]|nr:high mobility group [Coemansia sp. RSA 486]KAJ2594872.1 high mobility group [Coemansia sp. RSA 1722]